MPSTLGNALLGLLARQPQTGYELSQRLSNPIGYFWAASHSQIYPELAELERQGLVSHRVIDGPGPRDTKSYRITAAGRQTLADWVASPFEPAPDKDEFMLRIYSVWVVDPAAARGLVESERARHTATVKEYQRIEKRLRATHGDALLDPSTPQFGNYATLRRGLSYERHARRWCDWMLAALHHDP